MTSDDANQFDTLGRALDARRLELLELPGVVGTGVGRRRGSSELVVQVFVRTAEVVVNVRDSVSDLLTNVPVEVLATGEATARPETGAGQGSEETEDA